MCELLESFSAQVCYQKRTEIRDDRLQQWATLQLPVPNIAHTHSFREEFLKRTPNFKCRMILWHSQVSISNDIPYFLRVLCSLNVNEMPIGNRQPSWKLSIQTVLITCRIHNNGYERQRAVMNNEPIGNVFEIPRSLAANIHSQWSTKKRSTSCDLVGGEQQSSCVCMALRNVSS